MAFQTRLSMAVLAQERHRIEQYKDVWYVVVWFWRFTMNARQIIVVINWMKEWKSVIGLDRHDNSRLEHSFSQQADHFFSSPVVLEISEKMT